MSTSNIRFVVFIYCLGRAAVLSNDRLASLASKVGITRILEVGRAKINDSFVKNNMAVEETARLSCVSGRETAGSKSWCWLTGRPVLRL